MPHRSCSPASQIIQVNLTSDNPVAIKDGAKLDFTYTVNWLPTQVPFARRFERYLDHSFFQHKASVQWGGWAVCWKYAQLMR